MLFTCEIGMIEKIKRDMSYPVTIKRESRIRMKNKRHIISCVHKGSIAEELELEKGDVLLSVNGKEIEDIFD